MAAKITYFKAEDFKQRGIFNQFHSECTLDDLSFRRGDTLKNYEIKQVLDTCNKYNSFNINTLIVKDKENLTIWIEQKSQPQDTPNKVSHPDETPQIASGEQPLPTKVVTKKYRGQIYEETVVDWAAVQQMKKKDTVRRKYRGNYID